MDKFEVTNHTLKDKSFDLAKRENNILYCLDIPATVPSYEVQVTWIRHASFLIQLGRKYQILIDPVIEEIDGLVGKLGKYFKIGTLYAKSPLATEDLPFARESETPRENQTIIVAISCRLVSPTDTVPTTLPRRMTVTA